MSQPTPYNPSFDFSDWSTLNPDVPQPGVNLDAQFQAIKLTTDQTLSNLALIQRDDGELANGIVTSDSLDAALLVTLYGATVWATATAYTVGQKVIFSNAIYNCLVAHTSGVFATDLAAAKWQLVIDFGATTLIGTSASSVLIGTGAKVFTTQTNKNFAATTTLKIASAANSANFMLGTVTSYSGTTLTMNITNIGGSGTFADWVITLSGPPGVQGNPGADGTVNIGTLTAATTPDAAQDLILIQSFAAGPANRKMTPIDFFKVVNGLTETTVASGLVDFIPIYNAAGGITMKIQPVNVIRAISDLTEDTAPSMLNDFMALIDASDSDNPKKATLLELLKDIGSLTAKTTPDPLLDYIIVLDAAAGTIKKVTPKAIADAGSGAVTSSGNLLNVQSFTSSGTWTKPAGCNAVKVTVVGGGGGSGSSGATGGGGGGGTSSFGAFCTATGGGGGPTATTSPGSSAAGGVGSSGDLNINGNPGTWNPYENAPDGSLAPGGASILGGGGRGGVAGGKYGGGGGAPGPSGVSAGTYFCSSGGGGGASIKYISTGLTSTVAVTVGAGGGGATGGFAGAGGCVIVESYS